MEGLKKSFLVRGNNIVGFSDKNFSTAPIGTVLSFAGQTVPHGYLLADGASYKVADYPDLYAVIGNTYGGDTENFNVPTVQPPALTMVYIIKAFHTNEGVDSGVSNDVIEYVDTKISSNLGEKVDYKVVVEDGTRYVEDIVTQDINTWLPNDNSSILINLKKANGANYSNFQLLCNKKDSKNWSCIVNGAANELWKIRYVNGVRYIDEIATMDKVERFSTTETPIGTWVDGKTIYRTYVSFPAFEMTPNEWNSVNSLSITGINEVINARAKRSEDNAIIPLAARTSGTSIEVNPSANFGISKLILEYTKQ